MHLRCGVLVLRCNLEGATPQAVLYAVYSFLEGVLGCGWLSPGEEFVPELAEVLIGELDARSTPAFGERILVHFPVTGRVVDEIGRHGVTSGVLKKYTNMRPATPDERHKWRSISETHAYLCLNTRFSAKPK